MCYYPAFEFNEYLCSFLFARLLKGFEDATINLAYVILNTRAKYTAPRLIAGSRSKDHDFCLLTFPSIDVEMLKVAYVLLLFICNNKRTKNLWDPLTSPWN